MEKSMASFKIGENNKNFVCVELNRCCGALPTARYEFVSPRGRLGRASRPSVYANGLVSPECERVGLHLPLIVGCIGRSDAREHGPTNSGS